MSSGQDKDAGHIATHPGSTGSTTQSMEQGNVPTDSGDGQVLSSSTASNEPSRRLRSDLESAKTEHLFSAWQTALTLWDREADRFWVRSNVFLVIHGVLITFLITKISEPGMALVASILGLALSVLWYKVNIKGKWYMERWRLIILPLEEMLGIRFFTSLREMPDPCGTRSSTFHMRIGIIVFMLAYGASVLYAMWQLLQLHALLNVLQ